MAWVVAGADRFVMIFSLDFDGTVQRSNQYDEKEAAMWRSVIETFRHCGHQVVIVTARCADGDNEVLFQYADKLGIDRTDVHFTEMRSKLEYAEAHALPVDVWIDDNPVALVNGYSWAKVP